MEGVSELLLGRRLSLTRLANTSGQRESVGHEPLMKGRCKHLVVNSRCPAATWVMCSHYTCWCGQIGKVAPLGEVLNK